MTAVGASTGSTSVSVPPARPRRSRLPRIAVLVAVVLIGLFGIFSMRQRLAAAIRSASKSASSASSSSSSSSLPFTGFFSSLRLGSGFSLSSSKNEAAPGGAEAAAEGADGSKTSSSSSSSAKGKGSAVEAASLPRGRSKAAFAHRASLKKNRKKGGTDGQALDEAAVADTKNFEAWEGEAAAAGLTKRGKGGRSGTGKAGLDIGIKRVGGGLMIDGVRDTGKLKVDRLEAGLPLRIEGEEYTGEAEEEEKQKLVVVTDDTRRLKYWWHRGKKSPRAGASFATRGAYMYTLPSNCNQASQDKLKKSMKTLYESVIEPKGFPAQGYPVLVMHNKCDLGALRKWAREANNKYEQTFFLPVDFRAGSGFEADGGDEKGEMTGSRAVASASANDKHRNFFLSIGWLQHWFIQKLAYVMRLEVESMFLAPAVTDLFYAMMAKKKVYACKRLLQASSHASKSLPAFARQFAAGKHLAMKQTSKALTTGGLYNPIEILSIEFFRKSPGVREWYQTVVDTRSLYTMDWTATQFMWTTLVMFVDKPSFFMIPRNVMAYQYDVGAWSKMVD